MSNLNLGGTHPYFISLEGPMYYLGKLSIYFSLTFLLMTASCIQEKSIKKNNAEEKSDDKTIIPQYQLIFDEAKKLLAWDISNPNQNQFQVTENLNLPQSLEISLNESSIATVSVLWTGELIFNDDRDKRLIDYISIKNGIGEIKTLPEDGYAEIKLTADLEWDGRVTKTTLEFGLTSNNANQNSDNEDLIRAIRSYLTWTTIGNGQKPELVLSSLQLPKQWEYQSQSYQIDWIPRYHYLPIHSMMLVITSTSLLAKL